MKFLPTWRQRALAFQALSKMPHAATVTDLIRQRAGRMRQFDFSRTLESTATTMDLLRKAERRVDGLSALEVGTGWHPVLGLVLHGMGARRLVLSDLTEYVTPRRMAEALAYCFDQSDAFARIAGCPPETLQQRWRQLGPVTENWKSTFSERGVHYVAPCDLSVPTPFEDGSFQLVYSHSCLGFIPRPALQRISREMQRLLCVGGHSIHTVDLTDDHANTDSSIGPVDFLRYNDDDWERLGNSSLHYQNRMRADEFTALFEPLGFDTICGLDGTHTYALDRTQLDDRFASLSDENLSALRLSLTLRKMK